MHCLVLSQQVKGSFSLDCSALLIARKMRMQTGSARWKIIPAVFSQSGLFPQGKHSTYCHRHDSGEVSDSGKNKGTWNLICQNIRGKRSSDRLLQQLFFPKASTWNIVWGCVTLSRSADSLRSPFVGCPLLALVKRSDLICLFSSLYSQLS